MPTITIPQKIMNHGEYAIIPRKMYKEFLEWQRKVKSARTFRPTARDRRVLAAARKNFRKGNYATLEKLKYELGLNR